MSNFDQHPTAIVEPGAEIGEGAVIGPWCHIGPQVRLGAKTKLHSHVVVSNNTTIGESCEIFPFAAIGGLTQDLKYDGGNPAVVIGNHTTIREYATINTATFDDGATTVGDRCHIMAYSHIAHDCIVGNGVIIANAGTLAGHVIVEDDAIIGGLCGIHQFVRLGRMCIIGGCSKVVKDVPPFMMADGNPLHVAGVNIIGLQRRNAKKDEISGLREAYKILYKRNLNVSAAREQLIDMQSDSEYIAHLATFIHESERGLTK